MYRGHEHFTTVRIKKTDLSAFKILCAKYNLTAPKLISELLNNHKTNGRNITSKNSK